MLLLCAQVAPGCVAWNACGFGMAQQVVLDFFPGRGLDGFDGASAQREFVVGNDQPPVHPNHPAKAAAARARAHGGVEGEHGGLGRAVAQRAVGAVQAAGELPQRGRVRGCSAGVGVGAVAFGQAVHRHAPVAALQRHFNGFDGARALHPAQAKAVGHHVQVQALVHHALRLHFGKATGRQPLRQFLGAGACGQLYRKGQRQARVAQRGAALLQAGVNAFGVVVAHGLRCLAVKQLRGARKQQLEVVVQLGHRAHRGARAAHGVGLVDGNGRGHAFHLVHGGLVHAVEKLARVGAESLYVAALALGVERVKHQAGLARATHTGDHRELAGANVQVQVLEVVLARTVNADQALGHGRRWLVNEAQDSRKCEAWPPRPAH